MGQKKDALSGFSTAATLQHQGLIYWCDIVQVLIWNFIIGRLNTTISIKWFKFPFVDVGIQAVLVLSYSCPPPPAINIKHHPLCVLKLCESCQERWVT